MAYAKVSLLPLFLLATLVIIFPIKKVEADCNDKICSFQRSTCGAGCLCLPGIDFCMNASLVMKIVKKHPKLCESHADCTRKGSGSFCAYYPNSDIKYGVCFDSNSHAEASFKNALSSEFSNLLKMSSAVAT
ncbi:albumin-1-like [Vicia villosa]|uniref:albumin-1-like n=1 Tax=Vicia villosa TaxID=3911 RepID=UPI00273BC6F7|nr:albumin-1-like [Vicia villosa]